MRKKLLIVARGGLSLCSNRMLTRSRLSLSRSPKWVSIEVNNFVGQSKIQRRGWSYAASVPSDRPNSQEGRKRVSKDERRAMVESFVNTYRATNAGKFPTVSFTKKQIGGCYYVVREIIQELKYKSKLNPSNCVDENMVDKKCFKESKLLTTKTVKVLSGHMETAKDRPIQEDYQLTILDETDTGHKHLEEKRGTQTASCERSTSEEAVVTSAPSSHFVAAESNQLERDANENSGTSYGSAQSHESEFVDTEKCIEKTGYERREQAALKDLSEKHSQLSLQMPNDVSTEKEESSYSDFAASEVNLIKEEIKQASAPFSEISGSSQSKDHHSEYANRENHTIMEKTSIEKAEYDRREYDATKDLPGLDSPPEQGRGSAEMNQSKIGNSNRENNDAEVPKQTTLWGNLKSFADGIMNFWKKF